MAIYSPDGTVIFTAAEQEHHHPWCNHYMRERSGCKMCADFYVKYPISPDMIVVHFPNATALTNGETQ